MDSVILDDVGKISPCFNLAVLIFKVNYQMSLRPDSRPSWPSSYIQGVSLVLRSCNRTDAGFLM